MVDPDPITSEEKSNKSKNEGLELPVLLSLLGLFVISVNISSLVLHLVLSPPKVAILVSLSQSNSFLNSDLIFLVLRLIIHYPFSNKRGAPFLWSFG